MARLNTEVSDPRLDDAHGTPVCQAPLIAGERLVCCRRERTNLHPVTTHQGLAVTAILPPSPGDLERRLELLMPSLTTRA